MLLFSGISSSILAGEALPPLENEGDRNRVTKNFTMGGWVQPKEGIDLAPPRTQGLSAIKGQKYAVYPDAGHKLYGGPHSGAGISVGTNGVMVIEHSADYFSSVLTWEHPVAGRTHLTVVYRDGVPTLFINGEKKAVGISSGRAVHPGTVNAGPPPCRLGDLAGGWLVCGGALDDAQVHLLLNADFKPEAPVVPVVWAASGPPPKADCEKQSLPVLPGEKDVFPHAFLNPPDSTRPGVYWYWLRNNISGEGITKDLEAMKRVGIGRAYIANVDATPIGQGSVEMFTDEWWDLTAHAIREGTRLGVDIGVFNGPGWSQSGGPWVRPEQSMRYLTFSRLSVSGPGPVRRTMPTPADSFEDVAVLAFPEPPKDLPDPDRVVTSPAADGTLMFDGDSETSCAFPEGAGVEVPFTVTLQYPDKITVQNITVVPERVQLKTDCELQFKNAAGEYQRIKKFTMERLSKDSVGPMRFSPVTEVFPPVEAREFRVVFTGLATRKEESGKPAGIAEVELSNRPKLERYVEKQLGQMFPTPHATWNAYLWDRSPGAEKASGLEPSQVLNISECLDASGILSWEAPPGNWTVLRLGMAPTGVRNNSAPREGQGLEIDKLNRDLVQSYFDAYLGKLISRLSPEDRAGWKYVVIDSYEKGSQNWTGGFRDEFRDQYGYDPLPWLPVLAGQVVGSPDRSDRFLWDLRRLVADKIASDYAGTLRRAAHRNGLKVWMENYGHFGFPGEDLQYGGQADEVAGEFWASGGLGGFEVKIAASAGHIYGKPIISAESFTVGKPPWAQTPWSLKQRGDWAMAEGINHFVLHLFIHQSVDRVPGINAWFGTEFNRNNTWFDYMDGWIQSFRRTQAVLQEGTFVADLLYFTGEDAPKETGICDPPLPPGYNCDFINGEVILRDLSVRDGRFVLPNGVSYRLLVLPPLETMRPELLQKIGDLVRAGGAVLGNPPLRSPSLANHPSCDGEVRRLADELWAGIDGRNVTAGRAGKGCVFRGPDAASTLIALGVPPDIEGLGARPGFGKHQGFSWIHCRTDDADVYFLSNQSDEHKSVSPVFRIEEGTPELWDPISGGMRALPQFTRKDGRIQVPLEFLPRQSWLIAFRKAGGLTAFGTENFPSFRPVLDLGSEWQVFFDPAFGGPGRVNFDSLTDWTASADERIKYYSGTATYRTSFRFDRPDSGRCFLNLGEYNSIARVKLNGQTLGVVWTHPGRIEITGALRAGENHLEIEVAGTWSNRLVGDSRLPLEERITWTSLDAGVEPDTKLQPSGLIGPVMVEKQ